MTAQFSERTKFERDRLHLGNLSSNTNHAVGMPLHSGLTMSHVDGFRQLGTNNIC